MSRPEEHPRRTTEAPTRTVKDRRTDHLDYEEAHPAFGVAVVTRSSGTPRTLFQSDLQHNETIRLSIHRAVRGRSLMHDWIHPKKELIEVEMSLAQWGALVSSIGIGSGVPVTLRRTEEQVFVPELPYEPRIQEVLGEARGTVGRLFASAKESLAVVKEAVEGKKGIREIRDALRYHESVIVNAEGNAGFAVKSMSNAAEHVTSQAKADIEAHILAAAMATGLQAPILTPELEAWRDESDPVPFGELERTPDRYEQTGE